MSGDLSVPGLVAGCAILTVLPYVVWIARIWSNASPVHPGDLWNGGALFPMLGVGTWASISVDKADNGWPVNEATPGKIAFKPNGGFLWLMTICLVRLSILQYYKHLFPSHRKTVQALYVVAALCVCHGLGGIIACGVICHSVTKLRCSNGYDLALWLAIGSLFLNSAILIIPQPLVWSLPAVKPQKARVAGVFGMGLLVVGFSAVRCYTLVRWFHIEIWHANVLNTYMTLLEPTLGSVIACLPMFSPVLDDMGKLTLFVRTGSMLSNAYRWLFRRPIHGLVRMRSLRVDVDTYDLGGFSEQRGSLPPKEVAISSTPISQGT